MAELIRTPEQVEYAVTTIRAKCLQYLTFHGMKSMVIGMSGGLDSTTVAALMQPVAEELHIPLIGMILPIETKEEETELGVEAARKYCAHVQWFDDHELGDLYTIADNTLGCHDAISKGNLKARLRMIVLYNEASRWDGLVLSTDNLSEYLLGFWTLNGDVGDLAPIQYVFKGLELPLIAEYVGVPQKYITQQPTDGLGISTTDVERFGVNSYVEVDRRLIDYIEKNLRHEVDCGVIKQHEATNFKRNWPHSVHRFDLGVDISTRLGKILRK